MALWASKSDNNEMMNTKEKERKEKKRKERKEKKVLNNIRWSKRAIKP